MCDSVLLHLVPTEIQREESEKHIQISDPECKIRYIFCLIWQIFVGLCELTYKTRMRRFEKKLNLLFILTQKLSQ